MNYFKQVWFWTFKFQNTVSFSSRPSCKKTNASFRFQGMHEKKFTVRYKTFVFYFQHVSSPALSSGLIRAALSGCECLVWIWPFLILHFNMFLSEKRLFLFWFSLSRCVFWWLWIILLEGLLKKSSRECLRSFDLPAVPSSVKDVVFLLPRVLYLRLQKTFIPGLWDFMPSPLRDSWAARPIQAISGLR